MSDRLSYVLDRSAVEAIGELSRIALTHAVPTGDDTSPLPAGASGTVVSVLGNGAAYLVEFTQPYPALVELVADDFDTIPGESRDDLVAGRLAYRAS